MALPRGLPDGPHLDDDAVWRMDEDPATVLGSLQQQYGDIFTVHRSGAAPRVVLTSDSHIRELIKRDPDLYACGTSQFAQLVGRQSVNMLSGEPHRRMRQLLLPPLHGHALAGRVPRIRGIMREEFDRLRGADPVPLLQFTSEIALRVTASVLFSPMSAAQVRELCAPLMEIIEGIHQHRSVPPADRSAESVTSAREAFARQRARLDENLSAQVAAHRSNPDSDPASLLGQLLSAPVALTDQQILDQLATMLVAGHLTTASGLAMAAYWMQRPGEHAAAAAAELDALADDHSAADLAALHHVTAFCDEVLRIGSVVPHSSGRRTAGPVRAFGYELPAGTELIVSLHLAHRRPEVYPDPEEFDPRRFVDSPPSATTFVPFGMGVRRCPGAALATLEMKIFLACLRRTPGLELIGADVPFRTVSFGSTLAPPTQIRLRRTV
ncbi:MAG TPA: cytochrome P450 [Actinocrinis sp.]|uniref:cytochrome P450 n=1 Tax=Actinocrinis sp. TaxID=1920516 RepID=UPI002DDD39F8|nr:cytochrome P450 [Actinocrinis sp.]HEV2343424.1 cytochrome P450 [Actinocrinis sp.]